MVDADQAEQSAIRSGSSIFDAGVYDQRLAGAMDDFEPTGVAAEAPWHRQDLEVDTAVGQVHEEILRRSAVMGAAYPFEVSSDRIIYRPSQTGFYEFCLATSLSPSLSKGKFVGLPRLFERAVTIIVREYFGVHSDALHVGSPRSTAVGKSFHQAMQTLNKRSKEWFWSPRPDLPKVPTTYGDEGFDFVVWKDTLDQRNGRLFVIGQCACGDDWSNKFDDVNLARIGKWFQPLSFTEPVRALACPRHIATDWLNEALGQAGMVFDRARLVMVAERADVRVHLAPHKKEFEKLSTLVLTDSGPAPIAKSKLAVRPQRAVKPKKKAA